MRSLAWIAAIAFVAGFAAGATGAWAAQPARVDVDGVTLTEGPMKTSRTLAKLHKGQALAVSNYPTQGFYKARTSEGTVGWVSGDSLELPGAGVGSTRRVESKMTQGSQIAPSKDPAESAGDGAAESQSGSSENPGEGLD